MGILIQGQRVVEVVGHPTAQGEKAVWQTPIPAAAVGVGAFALWAVHVPPQPVERAGAELVETAVMITVQAQVAVAVAVLVAVVEPQIPVVTQAVTAGLVVTARVAEAH